MRVGLEGTSDSSYILNGDMYVLEKKGCHYFVRQAVAARERKVQYISTNCLD